MTNFALVLLIFSSLLEIRKNGWQKFMLNIGAFLIGALPVLIWKIRSGSGLDFSVRPEWLTAISSGAMQQIFYLFSNSIFLFLTFGGISAIALFFIARMKVRSHWHDRTIVQFMNILIGILIIQVITTIWFPLTFIIQLQISRASIFILIIAYVYFANFLAQKWIIDKGNDGNTILQTGSFFLLLSPAIPLLAWTMNRIKPELFRIKKYTAGLCLLLILCASILFFLSIKVWEPGISIYSRISDWVDVQNWARENTLKESIFITPPQEVGLYQPDWRVFSERGTVASLYDVFEIALKPDYYETWKPRFESLAPNAQDDFRGNYFENQMITRKAFIGLKTDQILMIAKRYDANYLVTEKETEHDLPVIYENGQYRIYKINSN